MLEIAYEARIAVQYLSVFLQNQNVPNRAVFAQTCKESSQGLVSSRRLDLCRGRSVKRHLIARRTLPARKGRLRLKRPRGENHHAEHHRDGDQVPKKDLYEKPHTRV